MTSNDIEALISYRMERSRESIQAAEIMLEKGMLTFAMNRIYYPMFYAVQAVLGLHGVSFSKHGLVKGYFNRELIKTGIFNVDLGKLYSKDPGPEGPALSSPLKGGQAPCVFETG
jgi:uncharacterized protein (UPF0332 family)